jgi:hypothetical protein
MWRYSDGMATDTATTTTDRNSVIEARVHGHGIYTANAFDMDRAIAKYLPASPRELRAIVTERTGGEIDYSDVNAVSAFLVILASFDDATS